MAKTPEAVYELLDQLWEPALLRANKELEDLQSLVNKEGGNFKIASWDWWYYSEKLREEKYDLNDEELKEFFTLIIQLTVFSKPPINFLDYLLRRGLILSSIMKMQEFGRLRIKMGLI